MTMREFVNNLLHIQYVYDRNMLKTLYKAVKDTPFLHITSSEANVVPTTSLISNGGIDCFTNLGAPILSQNGLCLVAKNIMEKSGDELRRTSSNKQRRTSNRKDSIFANPREQVDYKRGWLLKKSVYDSDGKRSSFFLQC